LTIFLVVIVTFNPTLNDQTFKRQNSVQRGKNLTADRGPLAAGKGGGEGLPMVQPAQWLILPWSQANKTGTRKLTTNEK